MWLWLALFIFFLNIPFGYLRESSKKFSFKWFLYVHLPVPIIITVRLLCGIKLTLTHFILFVLSYFSGQYIGSLIKRRKLNA